MSKIILTKKQAEFIEGFKKPHYPDNENVEITKELPTWAGYALHSLMEYGFGEGLLDANGRELGIGIDFEEEDFQHDQVPLLIEAIMHGYEVEKDKTVILYIKFYDNGPENLRKLYYGFGAHVTNKKSASPFKLNIKNHKERVEELKSQGWKVEEV
jgi:hypothetical protein